jgi:hypothetical protein
MLGPILAVVAPVLATAGLGLPLGPGRTPAMFSVPALLTLLLV